MRAREISRASPELPLEPSVSDAIDFLVERGVEQSAVRFGSIPATSLGFMAHTVAPHLPQSRPVRALHIGNFVGVSLAFLTSFLRDHHPQSVVVSIDPNTTHRGVASPQNHAMALLHHYGLTANSLLIPGYTLEQTYGEYGAPDEADLEKGAASVNVLPNLAALESAPFDLVLIDGNHDQDYLQRELAALRSLTAPGSIIVLDDVDDWPGVREALSRSRADAAFVELDQDGRVAVLQLKA